MIRGFEVELVSEMEKSMPRVKVVNVSQEDMTGDLVGWSSVRVDLVLPDGRKFYDLLRFRKNMADVDHMVKTVMAVTTRAISGKYHSLKEKR